MSFREFRVTKIFSVGRVTSLNVLVRINFFSDICSENGGLFFLRIFFRKKSALVRTHEYLKNYAAKRPQYLISLNTPEMETRGYTILDVGCVDPTSRHARFPFTFPRKTRSFAFVVFCPELGLSAAVPFFMHSGAA